MKEGKRMIDFVDLNIDYQDVLDKVLSHEEYWTNRENTINTFGAAAYMDDKMKYFIMKEKTNPLLKSLFSDLYEKIGDYFGAELNPDIAYTGFHIFDYSSRNNQASVHIDDQYQNLPIDSDKLSNPQSFTIAIEKPSAGAGLNVWPEVNLTGSVAENRLIERSFSNDPENHEKPEYIEYELGIMYIHNDHILHQIAKTEIQENERRVTMQGHVIQEGDKKYMYF